MIHYELQSASTTSHDSYKHSLLHHHLLPINRQFLIGTLFLTIRRLQTSSAALNNRTDNQPDNSTSTASTVSYSVPKDLFIYSKLSPWLLLAITTMPSYTSTKLHSFLCLFFRH
ncbi:unnamed protein product [Eruca vesicaria subsp. sativa]|uniref:Uncharacterized protein n=1 Tax=Eruca vesicaria subsp. sativa TaxID=29727 RepID=A0ABC8K017_ERUVS|nr:unnamed protein product [Eruca vesicaria subsp. sativa]